VPADVPTTGPNAEPGETPPVMLVLATEHTPAGAKAFAEFFIKTIDWGYATINGSYLRHFAGASCASCASIANGLDADRKAGHTYIGGRFTIIRVTAGASGATVSDVVTINGTSFEELDRAGKFVMGEPAHRGLRWDVDLRWHSGRWSVHELLVEQ
jgi:hypothetical protein